MDESKRKELAESLIKAHMQNSLLFVDYSPDNPNFFFKNWPIDSMITAGQT